MCSQKEKIRNVYIYKIFPIQILTLSTDLQNKILIVYKEFLTEINFDFQIVAINRKIYKNEIINNNKINNQNRNFNLQKKYINQIEKDFIGNNICITDFYIITNHNGTVEYVDKIFAKLSKIGCNVERVIDTSKIEKILYKCCNKIY